MFKLFKISRLSINSLGLDKYIIKEYIFFTINLKDPSNINFTRIRFYITPADILPNTGEILFISRSSISINVSRIVVKIRL